MPRGTPATKDGMGFGATLIGTTENKWVKVATILGEVTVTCGVVEYCRGATLSRGGWEKGWCICI